MWCFANTQPSSWRRKLVHSESSHKLQVGDGEDFMNRQQVPGPDARRGFTSPHANLLGDCEDGDSSRVVREPPAPRFRPGGASRCQARPVPSFQTITVDTPNSSASWRVFPFGPRPGRLPLRPGTHRRRISSACSAVSLCEPPRRSRGTLRRFSSRSFMLSRCVPSQRCAGFTQGGLSQRCSTCIPSGISPCSNIQDHRCVRSFRSLCRNTPYPRRPSLAPVQIQHSSGPPRCTRRQKSSTVDRRPMGRSLTGRWVCG